MTPYMTMDYHISLTIRIIQHTEHRIGDSGKRKLENSRKNSDKKDKKKCNSSKVAAVNANGSGKKVVRKDKDGSMNKTQVVEQKKCSRCGRSGHVVRECYAKSTSYGVRLEGCFKCGEPGHIKRDCPELKG
ncbi:DNA-binding protein HEXBP-like [Helianthus annuus]|uniref:DNA-binding protein HEXBP-like n=1 Tax=Helianthus annuus TaxID=4232 RepID=UPI000B905580|nr:DNA-binding protein HEXBP-like [Helianthus annuus]